MSRPIVAIHGVCGTREEVTGFGAKLQTAVAIVQKGTPRPSPVIEAIWADMAQAHCSREQLERAGVAAATAIAGPFGGAMAAALQALGMAPLATALDYIVDAFIYATPDGRRDILGTVRRQVEDAGQCVLYAHSLGSVIAIDMISDWIEAGRFDADPERWPAVGLVTVGSPLGIDVPLASGLGFLDRAERMQHLASRGHAFPGWRFPWTNYFDQDDPITDGSLWGVTPADVLEDRAGYRYLGVNSVKIGTGNPITSHLAYWGHPMPAQAAASFSRARIR